jgi:1-pyrroline-5-carboxylate dehydrogenase
MMGNTVVGKPATGAVYSGYHLMKLLMDAGLPDGVINFIPGPGSVIGDALLDRPDLAGIHFTGSSDTFRGIWRSVAAHLERYRSYPRIVGETGGKGFVMAHASADPMPLVCALVRGAFEYQGQKCSAASRAYIPDNLWPEVRDRLRATIEAIRMGDPSDFRTFMSAVIDQSAFDRITGYIDFARRSPDAEIIAGGSGNATQGYFIEPTIVQARDPHLKLMEEEIFGPVLTIFVYPAAEYEQVLELCDTTSPYALTGAVFARDRQAIHLAHRRLRYAAGNFYVNDKPTGAVVGLQPFGGSRASGTNDKAGSMLNLMRWVTPRTIKETFVPPTLFTYPYMGEK